MDKNKDDDMKKMLNAAQTFSRLANEEGDESASHFNFEQMMKAAEMFKNVNTMDTNTKKPAAIYFDEQLQTSQMKAVKSAIPYLPYKEQKYFGLLIKFMEIKNLLALYKNDEKETPHSRPSKDNVKILNSIKPYVDTEKQNMIEMCVKMIEMKKLIEFFNKEGLF